MFGRGELHSAPTMSRVLLAEEPRYADISISCIHLIKEMVVDCTTICTQVVIQPSSRRAYTMKEYEKAGAVLSDDLSQADTIIGRYNIGHLQHNVYVDLPNEKSCLRWSRLCWRWMIYQLSPGNSAAHAAHPYSPCACLCTKQHQNTAHSILHSFVF